MLKIKNKAGYRNDLDDLMILQEKLRRLRRDFCDLAFSRVLT